MYGSWADIHVPKAETFESKCEELKKDHQGKDYIVFYCMYGALRSPAAALDYIKTLGPQAETNNVYVQPFFASLLNDTRAQICLA